jgi:hypothetical protein
MNAVNIPRFTGEASLYRSRGYYRYAQAADSHAHHAHAADSHAHIIVPQLRWFWERGALRAVTWVSAARRARTSHRSATFRRCTRRE